MNECYCPNSSRQSRKAWIRANGPIPDGMCVLHTCDNFLCVNIDHLYLGTYKQNTADMFERGRAYDQIQPIKITDDIINRYINGESTADLALEIGVHRNAISKAARDRFGVVIGSGKNRGQ